MRHIGGEDDQCLYRRLSHTPTPPLPLFLLYINMSSPAVPAPQSPPRKHPHPYGHADALSPSSRTLVNPTHRANVPSIMLTIPGGGSDILNSAVVDAAGRSLFS